MHEASIRHLCWHRHVSHIGNEQGHGLQPCGDCMQGKTAGKAIKRLTQGCPLHRGAVMCCTAAH